MSSKLKTNFVVASRFEPFYTSGKVEISQDGEKMFTYSGNAVKIFDIASGRVEKTLASEDSDQISMFSLNPVTSRLITASRRLLMKEWDVNAGTCLKTWKAVHHAPVVAMEFDDTGELLATGSGDATIKIWHTALKCHTHSFRGSRGTVGLVRFHPVSSKGVLFSAADDCIIRVWNLSPAKQLAALEGHFSAVTDVQVPGGFDQLVSCGRDKVLILWDLKSFTQIKTLPIFEEVERIILLPNEDIPELDSYKGQINVLTGGNSGELSVWNLSASKKVYPKASPPEKSTTEQSGIVQLTYNKYSGRLFAVLADQTIFLYDFPSLTAQRQFSGYNDEIFDVRLLGQENFVVVATNSPRLKLYNLKTADCRFAEGHKDSILCVTVLGDTGLLATGSKDNDIRLWKFKESKFSLRCVAVASGHTSTVGALVASSGKKDAFIVSGSEDSTIKLWKVVDSNSGKKYQLEASHTEVGHDKGINSVAISPGDKWIASAGGDKTAKIWKVEPFSLRGTLRGHKRAVWCVQFAPHDQIVGTSSGDGTIKLWALSNQACVKTFEGHDCSVMKFAFLSRGLQIISSGSDGLLKLWDVRKNTCTKTFDEHDDKVWSIEVSKTEANILTGAGDSTFVLWNDVTESEQDEERQKEETLILQEQELSNLLQGNEYGRAFMLALNVDHPSKLLHIINEMVEKPQSVAELSEIVSKLDDFHLEQLLKYIVAWNTNSRHTYPAQFTLKCIFSTVHPRRLLGLSKIKSVVEGLIPYTERHAARLDQLHVNAMFFRYLWNNVKHLSDLPRPAPASAADMDAVSS